MLYNGNIFAVSKKIKICRLKTRTTVIYLARYFHNPFETSRGANAYFCKIRIGFYSECINIALRQSTVSRKFERTTADFAGVAPCFGHSGFG